MIKIKTQKTLLYKEKMRAHKDAIVGIYSPQGPKGGLLVSVSRDGGLIVSDLFERKLLLKR